MQGTPHSVARGTALGVIFGALMPPGLQLVTGVPVTLLLGGNVIAMIAGTFISNPFTYVPLYYFNCRVGETVLQACGADIELTANFKEVLVEAIHMKLAPLFRESVEVLWCWVTGGLLVGAVASVPGYYLALGLVVEVHKLRDFSHARRLKRRKALEERDGGPPPPPSDPDEEAPDEQPPPPAT